jgi:hypothetical protein
MPALACHNFENAVDNQGPDGHIWGVGLAAQASLISHQNLSEMDEKMPVDDGVDETNTGRSRKVYLDDTLAYTVYIGRFREEVEKKQSRHERRKN